MTLSYSHAHQQGSGTTEVVAVLVAITDHIARVLTVDQGKLLPNGPLMPLHRSLQAGVRQWVEEQTQQPLGYLEQLYTFVDTNRRNVDGHALVYVSYLGSGARDANTGACKAKRYGEIGMIISRGKIIWMGCPVSLRTLSSLCS